MVPYDVPVIAHDMVLRFTGVDVLAILGGSAHKLSSVGDNVRPISSGDKNLPVSSKLLGKTPEAQWDGEQLLLVLWSFVRMTMGAMAFICSILQCRDGRTGVFTRHHWCQGFFVVLTPQETDPALERRGWCAEENISLQSTLAGDSDELEPEHTQRKRKGNGQETKINEGTLIFVVDEADED